MSRPIGFAFVLLLFAAECVAWEKTYATEYWAERPIGSEFYTAGSFCGKIELSIASTTPIQIPLYRGWAFGATPLPHSTLLPPNEVSFLGFGLDDQSFTLGLKPRKPFSAMLFCTRSLSIPWWSVCLATAAILARRLLKLRQLIGAPGLCTTCGYDLRATPDRCPECGIIPTTAQTISKKPNTMTFGHTSAPLNPVEVS